MSLISNFEIEDETVKFNLNNNTEQNIKISLANAIRRTIISEISVYTIDPEKVIFFDKYEDDTILNQEFLIHRLTLIPLVSNLDIDYENVVISCKKENIEENIEKVYVKDFICKNSITDEVIETNVLFPYTEILFTELGHGHNVTFECKLSKNNATYNKTNHGDSRFSAVSACRYKFKEDMDKVNEMIKDMNESEKRSFLTQDNERQYERNKIGEPNVYEFEFESIGFYDCKSIINMAINLLKERLTILKQEFNMENSKKVIYLEEESEDNFFIFLINTENETAGNLLSTYLSSNENVFYAGYLLEHPLKKCMKLKLKLNNNNNYENIILIISNIIDYITNILDNILKDIESL
jgi:DNA-directed RNA polymerase subunit L